MSLMSLYTSHKSISSIQLAQESPKEEMGAGNSLSLPWTSAPVQLILWGNQGCPTE